MVPLPGCVGFIFTGFSRIFIGDHYLADVLAGYGLGIAWMGSWLRSLSMLSIKGSIRL
jgi:membrane-associated phospholipid phosphatase